MVRPVRWGKAASPADDPAVLLEQGPAGNAVVPAVWREEVADPLEITDDVSLEPPA